jgi:anti-sigma regulatory factor (Ser/Thr protein kinase)
MEASDCPIKQQTQIAIAVEEIFVNICHYAYSPLVGGVSIRIFAGDQVTIEFADKGTPYNPLLKADPDVTATAEERAIGGLGIFMVKKIMDAVEYRHEDNKNILVIRKAYR